MRRKKQVFYAIFSAFIFATALPNEFLFFGSPFLGFIALIPLYMAVANATSARFSGLLCSLQIGCTHLLSSYWLANFKGFAIFTLGASALAYFVWGYMFGQLMHVGFFYSQRKARALLHKTDGFDALYRVFIFCAVWVLWEYTKSTGFLAYPWGTLLMSSFTMPLLIQIADISGSFGISFLLALFSAVIAEGLLLYPTYAKKTTYNKNAYTSTYIQVASFCMTLLLITGIYGAYQYTKTRNPIKIIQTVLVQQNTDSWELGSDETSIKKSVQLTAQAIHSSDTKPDLVVWPESVLSSVMPHNYPKYATYPDDMPLLPFIRATQTPFIIGGPVLKQEQGKNRFYNSALYFDKNANLIDTYAKMQLVPFAEIIPYADSPIVQKIMKTLVNFSDGWTQGTEFTLFNVPLQTGESVAVSAPICYEDAFPGVCRALVEAGSEVFINITNDSWSKTKSAEYQHYVMASLRAIEFRTTLVRATQSGYTTVTNPVGTITTDLPLFAEASILTEVPVYEREETVFYRYGQWLIYVLLYGSFILVAIQLRKDKKEQWK